MIDRETKVLTAYVTDLSAARVVARRKIAAARTPAERDHAEREHARTAYAHDGWRERLRARLAG